MTYELRIGGTKRAEFTTEQEAVAEATRILMEDPNSDAEVIDMTTGHAAAPGSSKRWRDELRNKVGF